MPVGYGQLGCSGFIVSDKDGCFVSRKTRAYLEYGEAAFDYVESILHGLTKKNDNQPLTLTLTNAGLTAAGRPSKKKKVRITTLLICLHFGYRCIKTKCSKSNIE